MWPSWLAAWLSAAILLPGGILPGTATAEQLPVRAYGIQDGLAGDSVTDIVQDSRGYLWIATTDGVSRFDGERFATYGSADGLPHSRVYALLEGRDGTWWIATQGGLARFLPDRPTDRPAFETVSLGSAKPEPVFALHEDRGGRLWAGGAGRLFVLDPEQEGTGRTVREIGLQMLPARPASIEAFAETPDGSLWIGTQQGLLRRLADGRTSVQPVMPHHGNDRVLDLEVDRDGRLWVVQTLHTFVLQPGSALPREGAQPTLKQAADERGCLITTERAAALPRLAGEVCQLGALGDSGWRRAVASSDGRVRLVSSRGLFLLEDGRLSAWTEENGLTERSVTALAEDRDGNLWLGTEGSGAMRVARHGFTGYTAREGLADPRVLSIFEGGDGALYVHSGDTYDDQIWLHRFDGSRLTAVRPRLPPGIGYLGWSVRQSALLDRSGQWWIATGQGLLRYPSSTGFEDLGSALPTVLGTSDGLGGNSVERLFEDSRGDLWIGTNGARPLARWVRATGELLSFGREEGFPPQGMPSALAEDKAGQIWVGLSLGGLVRYRSDGGRLERFGPEHGLPDAPVSDLHLDRRGRLWVATEGGGLARLDAAASRGAPRFVRLTTREGLSSNELRCLTRDQWDRIYLGGHKGIDRLDPETGRVEHFTALDGLASNLVDAAWRDREGRLWFGTRQGLSQLVPVREPISLVSSPWITGVSIDGVPQRVSELGAPRVAGIELESGRRLEIDFLALSFAPGESLRYQVQMEGFDQQWSRASASRSVVYAHLPSGRFRFLVRAVTREDRAASVVPAEVLLVVRPPVWRRPWFLGLIMLTLAGGVVALYRYRVSHLLALERMRTRIATDLHDDLGSSLSRISILSELARRRAEGDPDGTRLVTDIGETAREMMDALSESIWAIDPRRDDLRSLATRIRRFAGDLMESRGITWSLQAPLDAEQVKLSPVERRQLYLIFKEALHNVARHAGASSVLMSFSISLSVAGRRLTATIRDDGRGFDEPAEGETRHGLGSMTARAADLGGELRIESASGRGTEIRLEVPLSGGNA